MISAFDPFRQFTYTSILLRLILAMVFGGIVGLERTRKGRPAGFRTYMLVCLGAVLTMLLGQFFDQAGESTRDVSRMGAQVVNGIGFLGAGTIIVTGKQEVKGLTTAAGLWASACVGLAIGAGFYECVFLAFFLVLIIVRVLPHLEYLMLRSCRNMSLYVEFDRVEHTGLILNKLRDMDIQIYDVEIDRKPDNPAMLPSVVLSIRLPRKMAHTLVLTQISELECIHTIEEL